LSQGHDDTPKRRSQNLAKRRERTDETKSSFYEVLLSASDHGFELAEHHLSKQLLFVFRGRPQIDLGGELESMGFDRTDDERMFTVDATGPNRVKAIRLAQRFSGQSEGMKR
jgi:hypothetical protein